MLIWSYWPGHEGGAERQCSRVVEAMSPQGIEFVILTSLYSWRAGTVEHRDSGQIVRLGILAPIEYSFRRFVTPVVSKIVALFFSRIRSTQIAQIIVFWLMLPVVWCARLSFIIALMRWFGKNAKHVSIIHVHESDWLAGVAAWIGENEELPVVAKVATGQALPELGYDVPFRRYWRSRRWRCHFLAQHHGHIVDLKNDGIPQERISVVPNGVVIPVRTADPEKSLPCLYVGNFSQGAHWKAFDVLIKAWALVHNHNPNARLEMVGAGDIDCWRRFAATLGCESTIMFRGMVPDPSLYYLSASMFILPSRTEGLSNALLEAQSYGLPCVVSDIPANLEVVRQGENGLIVPVGNAELLADSILKLLEDPQLRSRMGRAGRERISSSFSLTATAQRLLDVYRRLTVQGS